MTAGKRLILAAMLGLPAAALGLTAAARAAAPQPHVRGTVAAVSDNSLTVHGEDGQSVVLALTPTTRYVLVKKASLSDVKSDSFIGTATKDVGSQLVAVEVVVFPNAMRGTGEGHYSWDNLPDATVAGANQVATTMTNGTVSNVSHPAGAPPVVSTTMTNGTVSTDTSDKTAHGARELTVTYKGGEQHIMVPPNVPVVTLAPGNRSDLTSGKQVVVTEKPGTASPTAAAVAIGDGVKPPM